MPKVIWEHHSNDFFYPIKTKYTSLCSKAKQETKKSIAQNWILDTLNLCVSHPGFFLTQIKTPIGLKTFSELTELSLCS